MVCKVHLLLCATTLNTGIRWGGGGGSKFKVGGGGSKFKVGGGSKFKVGGGSNFKVEMY